MGRDFPSTKEKESSEEEDGAKAGPKEEGELDEDANAENSHAVQTNGEEEEDEELSGKMENGKDGAADDNAWLERDITTDLLHVIAKKSTGKLYRKLGEVFKQRCWEWK